MEKLVWSPQMSLGIPVMDMAHKIFVEELARLASEPDNAFGPGLLALIPMLEKDFREEEASMEAIDFPALQSHREQHARVLGALHHVVPEVMRGDFGAARKAIELLPQWFVFHLATMDTALAVALECADSQTTAPAI